MVKSLDEAARRLRAIRGYDGMKENIGPGVNSWCTEGDDVKKERPE